MFQNPDLIQNHNFKLIKANDGHINIQNLETGLNITSAKSIQDDIDEGIEDNNDLNSQTTDRTINSEGISSSLGPGLASSRKSSRIEFSSSHDLEMKR